MSSRLPFAPSSFFHIHFELTLLTSPLSTLSSHNLLASLLSTSSSHNHLHPLSSSFLLFPLLSASPVLLLPIPTLSSSHKHDSHKPLLCQSK